MADTHAIEHMKENSNEVQDVVHEFEQVWKEPQVGIHVAELIKTGAIEKSESPFAAPVVIVPKKDETFRLCIDYRALNTKTVRDIHPLPFLDSLLYKMRNAKFFTTLDPNAGYYHILRMTACPSG